MRIARFRQATSGEMEDGLSLAELHCIKATNIRIILENLSYSFCITGWVKTSTPVLFLLQPRSIHLVDKTTMKSQIDDLYRAVRTQQSQSLDHA